MSDNSKYYTAMVVFAVGALLVTYSSTLLQAPGQDTGAQVTNLILLGIGLVLTVGGGITFYYYRERRKNANSPEEMEMNAMIKAQEYKDSQKNQGQKIPR